MKKMNPGMMAMMAKKKPMKMNDGGMPMVEKDGKKVPAFAADGVGKMRSGGMAKKMAKGGGIEIKGKTKGKMIAMKKGGMGKAC
jgi:hypothetical protein